MGYGITLIDGVISNNHANCCYQPNQGVPAGGIDNNMGIMRLTNVAIYGILSPTLVEPGMAMEANRQHSVHGSGQRLGDSYTATMSWYLQRQLQHWGNLLAMINTTISNNVGLDRAVGSIGAGLFNTGVGRTRIVNGPSRRITPGRLVGSEIM